MARRVSKTKQLDRYKRRVTHARNYLQHEGYEDTWQRLVDLYKGKHFSSASHEDRIAVNLAFSTLNVIFPSISVNHPKITVQANKPEFEDQAVITEAVVNYWWRHFDFRKPFRLAAKDFLSIGHGWIKVGYRFVEEEAELDPAEAQAEFESLVAEADAYAAENPELAGDVPTDEEIAANMTETSMIVVEDRPFVERVSPADMLVDPEGTSEEDITWLAQKIVRPIEDVQEDERYKASVRRKVKADTTMKTDYLTDGEAKKHDSEIERVTVYEFYDLKAGTMCVFAEGCDDFLIEPQPMPYAFGHPFVMIRNYDVPNDFYPIGDLEMLEDVQQELNKTRSQMMNHRKKYARKYLFKEGSFDPNGRAALQSDEDNVMVPVVDDNTPLSEVVVPLQQVPLSADVYNYSEIIEADLDKISGVNEYARGATPEIRRTATEAAIIQDAANARAADKLAVMEQAIATIARKVVQLAQQFLTGEQVARIVGAEGQQLWVPFEADDIQGEFDFEVEGGSTQPNNETFRRQQAVAMMNSLGPLIGTVIDPQAIAKHVLQEGFGIKNPSKFIMAMPPMPPMGPEGAPPPEAKGEPGMNGEQPEPDVMGPADPTGGTDAVPPEIMAQLMGQVGAQPVTMGV